MRGLVLPPPSRECFPVKSRKQLHFFLWKGRNRFMLYVGRHDRLPLGLVRLRDRLWSLLDWRPLSPLPLSLWQRRGGIYVCDELSAWGGFIAHRQFASSFLGQAIEEGRLYVCVSL